MAAPMSWRRLVYYVYTPALTGVFTRISDRLFRTRDRRRGSSVLLLAPLLAESDPTPRPAPSSSPAPGGAQGSDSLHTRFRWMAEHVPAFRIPGAHIHVLSSPDQFYQVMKARIKTAKRRVVMASLYLGTGPLEQDLVDCMQEALEVSEARGGDLSVSVLLDFTRGSRGQTNSRTMLLPLLQRFRERMRVSLYHTPDLRGLLRLLVPQRFNETIGVQHIKVYLFDNSIIISGANLSESYFTNRQDRYVLLEDCGELCDFFSALVGAVGDVSLQLQPDDTVSMLEGMVHPYRGNRADFSALARERIMEVVNTARIRQQLSQSEEREREQEGGEQEEGGDTWVFPLVQMKPLGIQVDEQITQRLLTDAGSDSTVFLTSGYFNLTRTYMRLVLAAGADYRILTASPEVNGFFGAKGVAGAIPAAYIHIARQFYSKVCKLQQQNRVHLHEYHRSHWTFHAKGLWYYLRGQDRPCLTLIGSPNFGYRSVHRDLEAQIAIVTENPELQAQLQEEQEMLYERSTEVSPSTFQQPDRHVKLWVKLVTPLIKNFF